MLTWSSTQDHTLVKLLRVFENAVEPGHQTMNPIISQDPQGVGTGIVNIILFHGVEVQIQDLGMCAHNVEWGDEINLSLSENSSLHAFHIETVHIFPVTHFLLIESLILQSCHKDLGTIGPNSATFLKVFVSDSDNRI